MNQMERLYLDDLRVGQRFSSGSYVMEAARIKEFAAEFDPQPFHLDEAAAEASVFKGLAASGWHTAARPCGSSLPVVCHLRTASLAWAEKSRGLSPHVRATPYTWKVKLLRSRLPAPNRSKESSRFEARCSIKAVSRFTC